MLIANSKSIFIISILIIILAVFASLGGLFIDQLYQGNEFTRMLWPGNDFVTLVVVVPLLSIAIIFTRRGKYWAVPLWMGLLAFMLYNYAFYLFGAYYNKMFMIYVFLFSLSIFGLVFGIPKIDADELVRQFRKKLPVRWISALLIFICVGLTTVYFLQYFTYLKTAVIPEIIERTGHVTNIIPALDLSLMIPWYTIAAIWLWQKRPWGYLLATIVSIEGTAYLLVLFALSISTARAGIPGASGELFLWGSFCVVFLITSVYLLLGFRGNAED